MMRVIGVMFAVVVVIAAGSLGAQDSAPTPASEELAAAPATPEQVAVAEDETPASTSDAASPVADDAAGESDPELAEARRLGRELGAFDRSTWELLGQCESPGEGCLKSVEAHLAKHRDSIKAVYDGASVLRCQVDMSGYVSVRTKTATIGEAFQEAYGEETAAIDSLRKIPSDDPARGQLAAGVRSLEREFRQGICMEIVTERGYDGRPKLPTKRFSNEEPADS